MSMTRGMSQVAQRERAANHAPDLPPAVHVNHAGEHGAAQANVYGTGWSVLVFPDGHTSLDVSLGAVRLYAWAPSCDGLLADVEPVATLVGLSMDDVRAAVAMCRWSIVHSPFDVPSPEAP